MPIKTKNRNAGELRDWIVWKELSDRGEDYFRNSLLATGSMLSAKRETERFLDGTAVFEIDGDGSFEATVWDKKGLNYFSGVDATRVPNEARATCRALENQVRRAFDALPTTEAIRTIGVVWNMAEKVCELSAARSRILLGKLPKLNSRALPEWFNCAIAELEEEDLESLNPASLEAARRIVGCVAFEFPELQAQVSVGMLGRVTLHWYIESERCSWMLDPTDLPFPSTRIYEARMVQSTMHTRIIHDMLTALSALREIIKESNGN